MASVSALALIVEYLVFGCFSNGGIYGQFIMAITRRPFSFMRQADTDCTGRMLYRGSRSSWHSASTISANVTDGDIRGKRPHMAISAITYMDISHVL